MLTSLSVTVLIDNKKNSGKLSLYTEHGLSLWIEADGLRILFDTGQSGDFIKNADALGIDITSADMLILSHGHYDHTGGVAAFLDRKPSAPVYCHKGVFVSRFSHHADGVIREIGIRSASAHALNSNSENVHYVNMKQSITDDIGIMTDIPRISLFENSGGTFSFDLSGTEPDQVSDDLSLWFRTSKGLVIICGCCHSGIVNTIEYAKTCSGTHALYGVLGGLHLLNAGQNRLDATIDSFARSCIQKIVLCHCSGDTASGYCAKHLPGAVTQGFAGLTTTF